MLGRVWRDEQRRLCFRPGKGQALCEDLRREKTEGVGGAEPGLSSEREALRSGRLVYAKYAIGSPNGYGANRGSNSPHPETWSGACAGVTSPYQRRFGG